MFIPQGGDCRADGEKRTGRRVEGMMQVKRRGENERVGGRLWNLAQSLRGGRWRVAILGVSSAMLLGAQSISIPPRPPTIILPEANRPPDANDQMIMQENQLRKQNFDAANTERKRQIDLESLKLLILTRDLKARMDKIGKSPLPVEMMREAEMIEILAHDVQEKMKLTVGGG